MQRASVQLNKFLQLEHVRTEARSREGDESSMCWSHCHPIYIKGTGLARSGKKHMEESASGI